ncbi:UDP-glucose 4-epimerase GalE [Acetoanaerobium sticklandii]|uniref:UDP-glucose 4-epimerase GalE n=1 Tax=Acetoanaerobium sticklandii TaxID=1511 RepID=UPI003A93C416
MSKILLTGGAGYIGSHVVKMLGELGHELVIVDNLETGIKDSVLYGRLEIFDLSDTKKLEDLIKTEDFDTCFHFAGSTVVPESVIDPIKYYRNNTTNTLNLLELCVKYKINNFVFSSTAAVYGNVPGGICDETSPIEPITPYGRTKYFAECMLEDTSNACPEFNYVIFRYFNVAGANVDGKIGQSTPNATHLIKVAAEVAAGKRDSISIFGNDYPTPDGTCIRDFIHIDDLAMAHVDGFTYLSNGGKSVVLNCGYGEGYSVSQTIEQMKKSSDNDFKVITAPRRKGDICNLITKCDKIKSVLNWKPRYNNLNQICSDAYNWEMKK